MRVRDMCLCLCVRASDTVRVRARECVCVVCVCVRARVLASNRRKISAVADQVQRALNCLCFGTDKQLVQQFQSSRVAASLGVIG